MTAQSSLPGKRSVIKFKGHSLEFGRKTLLMGVLNSTPDSFYDGGKYKSVKDFITTAKKMVRDGADIIDIGGESTRPGAEAVSVTEEIRRVSPLIKALSSEVGIPISIDTTKSVVACEAVESGASIVNDIRGFGFDPMMASVVSRLDVPVVVMHTNGTPMTMQED
ncbi:MAG: dihydropteroate synthase, partial [Nitrospinota bacterium]